MPAAGPVAVDPAFVDLVDDARSRGAEVTQDEKAPRRSPDPGAHVLPSDRGKG